MKGKRVLFFAAQLFGYQNEIRSAIEKLGAIVDYFDERPANNFFVKAIIRLNRRLISPYINAYHRQIINDTRQFIYDYIFIIKGESISISSINLLRQLHPNAKIILYQWDSVANNKNALQLISHVDKNFSFDKIDCEKYGLIFRPLFFIDDYARVSLERSKSRYDTLFIGTIHGDRYSLVKKIEEGLQGKSYSWFYFPSRLLYYKKWLQDRHVRMAGVNAFQFKPMHKERILHLFGHAKAIIDIQHPKQTGLTMRCIETIGAKRKLITSNVHIKEYDFYNPHNILVIDRHNPIIDKDFINTPYEDIPDNIYQNYSINGWLKQVFNLDTNE